MGGNGTPKAAIYVRVSKAREEMISPEIQIDECRRYAKLKGYEVVAPPVQDLHKTGRGFAKQKIEEMIERVRNGDYEKVIVWKWSRWGRNLVGAKTNIALLHDAGGTLESATEPIDAIESAGGKLSLNMLLAIAEYQSDQMGEVWRDVHANRLKHGKPADGAERFGYRYVWDGVTDSGKRINARYEVDPENGPWLGWAYRQYNAGRGMLGVATELNKNGVLTSWGRPFTAASLRFTLDSGFGAGHLIRRGRDNEGKRLPGSPEYLQGSHAPVITQEEWETYLSRRAVKMPRRAVNLVTRVSGLVYCAACTRRMKSCWQQNGPRNARVAERAMKCPHQPGKNTKACYERSIITLRYVEDRVKRWLVEKADEGNLDLTWLAAAKRARASAEKLDAQIARQERRRAKGVELFMDDEIKSKDDIKAMISDVDAEIEDLRAKRRQLVQQAEANESPPTHVFKALTEGWDTLDHEIVNKALGLVIDRILISRGSKWRPDDRIDIVPKWLANAADLSMAS